MGVLWANALFTLAITGFASAVASFLVAASVWLAFNWTMFAKSIPSANWRDFPRDYFRAMVSAQGDCVIAAGSAYALPSSSHPRFSSF
ncbi:MAG: hypothetical protein JF588_23155 [Caulobacterales bacterium]|nr:hypothetical protein [Caulobacterales bacterium]